MIDIQVICHALNGGIDGFSFNPWERQMKIKISLPALLAESMIILSVGAWWMEQYALVLFVCHFTLLSIQVQRTEVGTVEMFIKFANSCHY